MRGKCTRACVLRAGERELTMCERPQDSFTQAFMKFLSRLSAMSQEFL